MEGIGCRNCLSGELSGRLSSNRCQKQRFSCQTTKSRCQFVPLRFLLLLVLLTSTFQPNMAERISGEGLRTDVKYDGSSSPGLRRLSRLLTIIDGLRFLESQNLLEQQNYDDDDDDDDDDEINVNNDDDDSGKGGRKLTAGSRLRTGHNGGFIRRSMSKRGPGSCINGCMGRGMSFIRCKSMCN